VGTGHLTLDHVTVRDNAVEGPSAYAGGALAVTADTVDTTIADNVVRATVNDAFAGGLLVDRGGGQLRSTTISGNLVHGPAGAHGGGLDHADRFAPLDTPEADLTLVNTTITGNTAESTELDSYAGGIEEAGVESLALLFSTVSGNSADVGANLAGADATAAAAPDSGTIELTATVVSEALGGGANCAAVTIAHSAFAHVTDTSCGTATSADPQLGTLADNGGPTLTMLPTTASPLVGQVPTDACLARVAVDQRGVTRPQGTACTIGAVEVAGPVIPDPPLTPPDVPTTPAAGVATAPTAIVAEPRFTG
jgi:hypothetical protein